MINFNILTFKENETRKKEYKVEVLHRNEIPERILEKNYAFPCVIGETEHDLTEIIDSVSFSGFRKTEGVKELHEKLFEKVA